MEKNKIIITVISILTLIGFLTAVYLLTNKPKASPDPQLLKIKPNDNIKWSKKKKIVLIEYSDLQCPACKGFHQLLKQIETKGNPDFQLTKKITFVYRHFPLIQIHQNALTAAYAAEAAGQQEKFFPMVNLLFENQDAWADSKNPQKEFIDYAKKLNLNLERFKRDLTSKKVVNKVQQDARSGSQLAINSTPTFFLNGKKLEFRTLEEFKKQLGKASQL